MESAAYKSGAVAGRYLGQDRMSPAYVAAINDWINNCISTHPNCRQKSLRPETEIDPRDVELPTRCVEVKKEGGTCLRETKGVRGSYITLSHRWSDNTSICKTQKSNYDERVAGQNLEALPEDSRLSKTFLDAIQLARALGIKYIWIDSLCIIQDSHDGKDFDNEKWRMGQYYQYSIFTIAAISGTSSQGDGFLEVNSTKSIDRIIRLPYFEDKLQRGYIYIYKRRRNTDLQFMEDVDQSELLSRGWVFQEWMLSRRIIYFTASEAFMECESHRPVSICNDEVKTNRERNEMSAMGENENKHFRNALKYKLKVDFNVDDSSIYEKWYWCCEAYSSSELTQKSDCLNAISGIAGEYAPAIMNQAPNSKDTEALPAYLSGLWCKDIHHGLLWIGRVRISDRYKGAPSWSWMSFGSYVSWPDRHVGNPTVPSLELLATSENNPDTTPERMTVMVMQLTVKAEMLEVTVRTAIMRNWQGLEKRDRLSKTIGLRSLAADPDRPGAASEKRYRERDYIVSPRTKPEEIAGWLTLEGLGTPEGFGSWDFEKTDRNAGTVTLKTGITCLLVHVATRKNVPPTHKLPRFLKVLGHDVYEVLVVKRTRHNSFRRLGMGMVFGSIIDEFEQKDKETFQLE
jgi:hypothetical protein